MSAPVAPLRVSAGPTAAELLARPPADSRFRRRADGELEAVPPATPCVCGRGAWRLGMRGWECSGCWRSQEASLTPGDVEAACAADRTLRAQVRAAEDLAAQARRRALTERVRDRRPLRTMLPALRAVLLHRLVPTRYPLPAAAREFAEDRLLDLVQKYLELTGHEDPSALRAGALVSVALLRGVAGWTRAHGFEFGYDAAGVWIR